MILIIIPLVGRKTSTSPGAVSAAAWEGNRRSVVAPATRDISS